MASAAKWFYLSFIDPDKPRGTRFLSACIVSATDFPGALAEAWRKNVNPGGEVEGSEIPEHLTPDPKWVNRRLCKADLEQMDTEYDARRTQSSTEPSPTVVNQTKE